MISTDMYILQLPSRKHLLQIMEIIKENQNQEKYKNVELSSKGHIYKTTLAPRLKDQDWKRRPKDH